MASESKANGLSWLWIALVVVALAILAYLWFCPCDRHKWREIEVHASYSESTGLVIDEEDHDIGVSGPGDTLSWVLKCRGCPKGTHWRLTDFQMVADLHHLTGAAVELLQDPEYGLFDTMEKYDPTPVANPASWRALILTAGAQPPEEVEIEAAALRVRTTLDRELGERVREWLGIRDNSGGMAAATEAFEFPEPGWDTWAQASDRIQAIERRDDNDPADELWKFAVEIRVPGYSETLPCAEDPNRACWDPHNYRHPGDV